MACSTQFMPFLKFNPRMQDATRELLSSKPVNRKLPRRLSMPSRWCLANYSLIPPCRSFSCMDPRMEVFEKVGNWRWRVANGYSKPLGYPSFFCWVCNFACSWAEIPLYVVILGKVNRWRKAVKQLLLEMEGIQNTIIRYPVYFLKKRASCMHLQPFQWRSKASSPILYFQKYRRNIVPEKPI